MVGEARLPSNAYYPWMPDYTSYSGVHVCWSEHPDSSFVYGFMSLDFSLGTMTATTFQKAILLIRRRNILLCKHIQLYSRSSRNHVFFLNLSFDSQIDLLKKFVKT